VDRSTKVQPKKHLSSRFFSGVITLLSLQRGGGWVSTVLSLRPSNCADLVNKTSVCRVNEFFIFHMFGRQKDPKTACNYLIQERLKDIGQTISLCHNKTRCFLCLSAAIPVHIRVCTHKSVLCLVAP
jgi:hypothetical protein